MKKLLLLILIISLFSCKNNSNENKQKCATQLIDKSELSPQIENNLPLGFKFGLSSKRVKFLLDSLTNKKVLVKSDSDYNYEYKIGNKNQNCLMEFGYHEDKLYALRFNFVGINNLNETENTLISQISKEEGSKYSSMGYESIVVGDKINIWVKDNKSIELLKTDWLALTYTDNPVNKIIRDIQVHKDMQKGTSENTKVVNSAWDGSVSQVEKYIKDNLNDPDSYKSVKWSVIYNEPDGYKVAHEYRAKNGFGAVITKRQIFYLNFNGEVTKVEE
jgi:hypothetical protein